MTAMTHLASCTTSAVPCDDTGTSSGVWPVVAQVVLAVLVALAAWALARRRRHRTVRAPQRRVRISASGELLELEDLRRD